MDNIKVISSSKPIDTRRQRSFLESQSLVFKTNHLSITPQKPENKIVGKYISNSKLGTNRIK